jgi:P4 family phage/plasmid primase-like protien
MNTAVSMPIDSSNTSQSLRDISVYLKILFANVPNTSFIGLSINKKGTKEFTTNFLPVTDTDRIIQRITQKEDRANIYLRVSPTTVKPLDGRGVETDSAGVHVLWADIDCSSSKPEDVVTVLQTFDKPPTLILHSGHGIHAYWRLTQFATDIDGIRARNKGLMLQINKTLGTSEADHVYDVARIMRVPGTWNVKNGKPLLSKIVAVDETRLYDFDSFEAATLEQHDKTIVNWEAEELPLNFLDDVKDRDKKLYMRIFSEKTALKADVPITPDGEIDHSRNDAYIVTRLLTLGYSTGICIAVLTHFDWLSGTKYHKTLRFSYVVTTVDKLWKTYQKSPDRFFGGKGQFQPQNMAQHIEKATPFLYTAGALWRYDGGVYRNDGEQIARHIVWEQLGAKWVSKFADETVKWLRDGYTIPIEQTNQQPNLINCTNGMLNINTLELVPHSQEFKSLAQIPVVFNPDVDTTQIDRFLMDVLTPDTIPVFWEFVGSAFITNHYWPKYFMTLVGKRDSGKSKVAELLTRFYGLVNIKAIPFQALADNRFALVSLFGKLANIFDDLNENEAQNTGQIKALTGDAFIGGEQKFGGYVEFKNVARLIFTANHFPPVKSPDDAFFSRALLIHCPNTFTNETADSTIVDKLTTPDNLSAILSRAVQGVQRLTQRGYLQLSPSIETMQAEYRFSADTVLGFYEATTVLDPDGFETKERAWQRYKTWCANGGRKNFSQDKFFKRVAESMDRLKIRDEYKTVNTERLHCYVGRAVIPSSEVYPLR